MSVESVMKALSRETKALIIVSEFEARRMPMFQLRSVLHEIVTDFEEQKVIIDLVENDLRATGYHPNQISAFLGDLLDEKPAAENNLRATRRLRSPFSMGFEDQAPDTAAAPAAPTAPAAPPPVAQPPAAQQAYAPQPTAPSGSGSVPAVQRPGQSGGAYPTVPAKPGQSSTANPSVGGGVRVSDKTVPAGIAPPKLPTASPPQQTVVMPTPRVAGTKGTASNDPMFFGGSPMGMSGAAADAKPRVLLADDDKRIRIVFRLTLERLGFNVLEAEDGNEAWKKMQQGGLNLAVLDMKMPGLHGLEVLQRMVDSQMTLPVIICSAYDQLKDEFVVATYPKLRYLVKPVAAEDMEKAVKDLCGALVKGG